MLYAKPSSVFWIYLPFQVTLQTDYKVSLVTCHGQTHCIWCKCQEEHSPSSEVWADSPPQLTFSNEDKEYWFQQQTLPEQLNPSCWTQWTQLGCSCSSHSSAGSSSCQGKGSNSHKRDNPPRRSHNPDLATTTAKTGPHRLENILGKCTFLEGSVRSCFLKI